MKHLIKIYMKNYIDGDDELTLLAENYWKMIYIKMLKFG